MREIPLTQDKIALVDDDDYERVSQFKWCAVQMRQAGHSLWYGKRCISQDGKRINCYLHRFILGVPDAIRIDHQDGDGLNCQKANIRYASAKQNTWNSRIPAHNTSGFKGVQFLAQRNRWQMTIRANDRVYTIQTFEGAEEAALVYDAAARHFFGEFARTNRRERDAAAEAFFANWMNGKRRRARRSSQAILTDDQVREMRTLYASGVVLIRDLMSRYGVCYAALSHAIRGRTFKHVLDPPPILIDKRTTRHLRSLSRSEGAEA